MVESACAKPTPQAHTLSCTCPVTSGPAQPLSTLALRSAHALHAAAPGAGEVKPAGQLSQLAPSGDVAPTGPNWPAGQMLPPLHADATEEPSVTWPKVPDGHGVQLAAPALAEYEPAAHTVQLEERVLAANLPAGQFVQVEAPASANLPAAQAVQPAAVAVPLFVTVPAKPGAQIVHADTLVSAAPGAEVMPVGQLVQVEAPAAEYEPVAHAVQPAALAKPLFVTVPAKPAAHCVHAATDVLPSLRVVMPVGQLVQVDEAPPAEYEPAAQIVQPAAFNTVPA